MTNHLNIAEWYASDVSAGIQGDPVGAAGFAGKTKPLAMALLRLFVGDNTSAKDIVQMTSTMLVGKAYRDGWIMPFVEAEDIARMVLAWHRDGVCRPCGGHGYTKIDGAPGLSEHACPSCRGTRKVPFEPQFKKHHVQLARWLASEVEREQAIAEREAKNRLRLHIAL